jgi:hypothetical protein
MSDSLTTAHDEDEQSRHLCKEFDVPLALVKTYGGFRSVEDVVEAYAKMRGFPMESVPKSFHHFGQMKYIKEKTPSNDR